MGSTKQANISFTFQFGLYTMVNNRDPNCTKGATFTTGKQRDHDTGRWWIRPLLSTCLAACRCLRRLRRTQVWMQCRLRARHSPRRPLVTWGQKSTDSEQTSTSEDEIWDTVTRSPWPVACRNNRDCEDLILLNLFVLSYLIYSRKDRKLPGVKQQSIN